jgi:hypothetical protein
MSQVVTVPELLDGHMVLDIECLDRIYLNGYVPLLQVGGQVITFTRGHLGMPIASPAVFEKIGTQFRQAVGRFAEMNDIPMVKFSKGMRKIDVMQRYLRAPPRLAGPGWWRSAGRRSSSWCGMRASATPTRPGPRSSGSPRPSAA